MDDLITQPAASDAGVDDSEVLFLDAETRADLNLFGSAGEGDNLFGYCNRCRCKGRPRFWPPLISK